MSATATSPTVKRDTEGDRKFVVYLSGSIKKGDTDGRDPVHFWTDNEISELVEPFSFHAVEIINPATAGIRRSDYWANFGCDLHMVSRSDVVIVDARTEKGIGVGGEMMWAHSRGIPVISVAPRNTNYRRDLVANICGEDLTDWIHPFVFGLSSAIADSFAEAGAMVAKMIAGNTTFEWRSADSAIAHYRAVAPTWNQS